MCDSKCTHPPKLPRCNHEDWLVNSEEEQICPKCDKTFFEIIKELEYDNMVLTRMLDRDVGQGFV